MASDTQCHYKFAVRCKCAGEWSDTIWGTLCIRASEHNISWSVIVIHSSDKWEQTTKRPLACLNKWQFVYNDHSRVSRAVYWTVKRLAFVQTAIYLDTDCPCMQMTMADTTDTTLAIPCNCLPTIKLILPINVEAYYTSLEKVFRYHIIKEHWNIVLFSLSNLHKRSFSNTFQTTSQT